MDDFDRVKSALDIKRVILESTGLQMKRAHLESCPFCGGHDCFNIKDADQYFKCFQCDAKGDVLSFLSQLHKIEPAEALKRGAELAGISLAPLGKPQPTSHTQTVKERIFEAAARHYHSHMLENGGRDWLTGKRGHAEDLLAKMNIGWTSGRLKDYLAEQGFNQKDILESRLVSQKDEKLFDFFPKGVAIFPHHDEHSIIHFTIKDPQKKVRHQLPLDARGKGWAFYNQVALKKHKEVILVEGENDLLSVMSCGITGVIALIGQVSDEQIGYLKKNAQDVHLYLWVDKDAAGIKYVRKMGDALAEHMDLRVIWHQGEAKDPDEYLQAIELKARVKEIKRLREESLDFLSWDVDRISEMGDMGVQLDAMKERHVFSRLARLNEAEKLVVIERITKKGLTQKAIEEQIEKCGDLRQEITRLFGGTDKVDPMKLGNLIFNHFGKHGRFFRDSAGEVYLLFNHVIYQVGDNRPFSALMMRTTGLLPTKNPGREVWKFLELNAFNSGLQIDVASWLDTDRAQDAIFINLNLPSNRILKITPQRIEELPNGMNENNVLLKSSNKIKPFRYRPDASMLEGLAELKRLVMDNLTCEREQRMLILSWLFSAFLPDFTPYVGVMKFSGASASGKTTAARLLSLLLYGSEELGEVTGAAAYAVAAQNPLLVIDNLEQGDITKSVEKFILLLATRGSKEKRAQNTDGDTITERPRSLLLVTAIEPFTKAELINRTYDIEFSSKFKDDGFIEDTVVGELLKKRDEILSAMLKFLQSKVLPEMDKRSLYLTVLKQEYRGHAKNRTDEYLALLMMIMTKLLPYSPLYDQGDFLSGTDDAQRVWSAWIKYQNDLARETETQSNSIVHLLDAMQRSVIRDLRGREIKPGITYGHGGEDVQVLDHPTYDIEFILTKQEKIKDENGEEFFRQYVEFVVTSNQMVRAMNLLCREMGVRNPYSSAAVFGKRLSNDKAVLEKMGWRLIGREEGEHYFKTVQGQRYWKFQKEVIY